MLATDYVDGLARGWVEEESSMGFVKHDNAGTSVEQECDPGASSRVEAESEEWLGVGEVNNLGEKERTMIVGRAVDRE